MNSYLKLFELYGPLIIRPGIDIHITGVNTGFEGSRLFDALFLLYGQSHSIYDKYATFSSFRKWSVRK